MKLPPFRYERPASLDEALSLLAGSAGDAKVIAGGQTLLPIMAFRLAAPSLLVDIGGIAELRGIRIMPDRLEIGATTRWCDILGDARLAAEHPLLQAGIGHVAHYQIRNRGTVGGSLAHADPAAEMPGIAAACDASIVIAGPDGKRTVPFDEFFLGALTTILSEQEIIAEIHLPRWTPQRRWAFLEFARRSGDFALAAVALHYLKDDSGRLADVHVGVMGVCDRPCRIDAAEAILNGNEPSAELVAAAAAAAAAAVDVDDDLHASQAYRKALIAVLVERAFEAAEARGG